MKSLSSIQLIIAVALLLDTTTAFTAQRGTSTAFHAGSRMARSFASPLSATDDSMSMSNSKADTVAPMMSTSSSRWWNPLSAKSSSSSNGNSGSSVDDYLEFLERRYSRLYDNEQKQESRAKFSVMSWLQQGEASESTSSTSNAMYALGVAGIAGKQLLEKHSSNRNSLVTKQVSFEDAQIVDKTLSTQLSSETTLFSSVIATKVGPIFRKISHKRQMLIRYESQKLKAAVGFLLKSALRLPVKVGKAVWNMGGGKKTIALTFTVAAALTLVLMRPIAEAVSTSIRQA